MSNARSCNRIRPNCYFYLFSAATYAPIFPQMPLEIVFSADFTGFGTPDAKVELFSSCESANGPPVRPDEFIRPTQPSFVARRVTKKYIQTPKPAVNLSRVEDLYTGTLVATMDIPQCSAWQPAGRLPGTGQVFPRWISSGKCVIKTLPSSNVCRIKLDS